MNAVSACVVWPVAGQKEALVCGLWWHTVLGKDAMRRARKLARQHKAQYMAQDADRPEGVGLLSRRAPGLATSVTHYSAALILASMYPKGVVLACLQLSATQWWVVGIQEGKVLQATDRILDRIEDRDELLHGLVERFGAQALICGDGHEEAQEVFSFEAVLAHRKAAHQLKRVIGPRWQPGARWPLVMGGAAALTVAARLGWDHVVDRRVPPEPPLVAEPVLEQPSAEDVFAAQTWVLPNASWPVLLDAVTALPLWLGGWRFQQARCAPQHRQWSCQVQYERVHAWANNLTFWKEKPADWRLEWQPMESVVAHVVLNVRLTELDLTRLLTRHDLDTNWISGLQQHQQRWQTVALGPWQPARTDGAGGEVPSVLQRGVSVQAPLQSLAHFPLEQQGAWSWHQLLVTLHPQAQVHARQPLLLAQLKGVSYARL